MTRWVLIASAIWLGGILLSGFVGYLAGPTSAVEPSGEIGTGSGAMFLSLTSQNLLVILVMLSGAVTFGVTTLISLLASSLYPGLAIGAAVKLYGTEWVLRATVVHSVIEIPSLLLASGAGLMAASCFWKRCRGDNIDLYVPMRRFFISAVWAVAGILIASVLETWITPMVLEG